MASFAVIETPPLLKIQRQLFKDAVQTDGGVDMLHCAFTNLRVL